MANLKNTIKKCIACNNSTTPIQYKDTFISMSSVEGIPDMLYVDESTGDIYIWNGTTYITADVPTIPEARICLNDTAFNIKAACNWCTGRFIVCIALHQCGLQWQLYCEF